MGETHPDLPRSKFRFLHASVRFSDFQVNETIKWHRQHHHYFKAIIESLVGSALTQHIHSIMVVEREELRPIQEDCLNRAIQKNLIVCLPTGHGKTLIAARLIEQFLETCPGLRAVFLVPTQALVDQQAKYCREQIRLPGTETRVFTMVGNDQAGWNKLQWKEAFDTHHIFLGTPAVFHKAVVTHSYLSIGDFSVVVFDECHYAKGGSPMARLMRDAVHPHLRDSAFDTPRILGLTASFAIGSVNNLEKDRWNLEKLLHSTMFCPQVTESSSRNYIRVTYKIKDGFHTSEHESTIKRTLETSLTKLGPFKDLKKALNQCSHVFTELGRDCLKFYVEYAIVQQIQEKITYLEQSDDEHAIEQSKKLKRGLPILIKEVKAITQRLSELFDSEKSAPARTSKLQTLLDLLMKNFSESNVTDSYRGIVFVERISLVAPLAQAINNMFQENFLVVRCGVVAGSSAQPRAERSDNLEAFRNGQVRILVATSACEEGLDVPQCQFSIMYSEVQTSKSHTQRSGRVRSDSAELYYFENDPHSEIQKAAKVQRVAMDSSLALSAQELKHANASICAAGSVSNKHPYPSGCGRNKEGLVSVDNCKPIFLQYCSTSLGGSASASDGLYDLIRADTNNKEVLVSVKYPSPQGWKVVERKEVQDFWGGEDLTKIFSAKSRSVGEREELLFLYVVVRKLRGEGLLDCHNTVPDKHKSPTKLSCPLQAISTPRVLSLKQSVAFATSNKTHFDRLPSQQPDNQSMNMPLEMYKDVLKNFIAAVFETEGPVIEDDLFVHEKLADESGRQLVTPTSLKYPTPSGWESISYAQYQQTFGVMDLDDQLGRSFNRLQKMEMAFAYLAVHDLHELGYVDDKLQLSLTPAALQRTRRKCPFPGGGFVDESFVAPALATPSIASGVSAITDPSGFGSPAVTQSLVGSTTAEVVGTPTSADGNTMEVSPADVIMASEATSVVGFAGGSCVGTVELQSTPNSWRMSSDVSSSEMMSVVSWTNDEPRPRNGTTMMETSVPEAVDTARSTTGTLTNHAPRSPHDVITNTGMFGEGQHSYQSVDDRMADSESEPLGAGETGSLLARMVSGSSNESADDGEASHSEMIGPVALGGQFDDCDEMSL
jgi:ERCC4-related helicase